MGFEILGKIEIFHKGSSFKKLEHSRKVPDDITDRREDETVKAFKMIIQDKFHDTPWHMAYIRLVICISFKDQLFISPSKDADGQAVCGMYDLPGKIYRPMTNQDTVTAL